MNVRGAVLYSFTLALCAGCGASETFRRREVAAPQCASPVLAPPPAPLPSPALGYACGDAHFWSDGSTGHTWQQSRELCRALGGDLASLHSEAETACANRVLVLANAPGVGAWVGLSEEQQEGAWGWSDGSPLQYAKWIPGEPNNDSSGPSDCGHIWRDQLFGWNDMPCTRTDVTLLCRLP